MSGADWIILIGAGTYLGWTVNPNWYRIRDGNAFGIPLPSYTFNAWRGTTMFAALAALLAMIWVGVRLGGPRLHVALDPSLLDAVLAGLGLALTGLALVLRPRTGLGNASPSWGLVIGVVLAGVWLSGALWRYRERTEASLTPVRRSA